MKTSTHNTSAGAELVNGLKNRASESLTEAASEKDLSKIVSFWKRNFAQNWRLPARESKSGHFSYRVVFLFCNLNRGAFIRRIVLYLRIGRSAIFFYRKSIMKYE